MKRAYRAVQCVCVYVGGGWNAHFIFSQIMRLSTCHLREEFQLSLFQLQTFATLTGRAGAGQVYIHATHSSLLLVKLISIHPEICEIEFVEGSILATLYFQGQRVFPRKDMKG